MAELKVLGADRYGFVDRSLPIDAENDLTRLFETIFARSKGDVFVDAGAHIGTWTLRLAQFFRHVVAFEPHPDAHTALLEHLRLNDVHNVIVHRKGLSRSTGSAKLFLYDMPGHAAIDGHPTLPAAGVKQTGVLDIDVVALDSVELPGKVDLLKIDTEGHEEPVLEGAASTLSRDRPRLCIEGHTVEQRDRCIRLLGTHGLDRLRITPEQRYHDQAGWLLRN